MIRTIDNHDIVYIEENTSASDVVLMCHGITSSKEEGGFYNHFSAKLIEFGFSTFRFDFRGHGDSAIPPIHATIAGMIADLNCVIDYLSGKYQTVSIVAASFGASILLLLMQQEKPSIRSVVLLNPVTDYCNTFTSGQTEWSKSFFPIGGLSKLLAHDKEIKLNDVFTMNPLMGIEFYFYKPNAMPWNKSIPAIVLHGAKDAIVQIANSRNFVNNSNSEQIKLMEFADASHGLEENIEEVIRISCEFMKRWS